MRQIVSPCTAIVLVSCCMILMAGPAYPNGSVHGHADFMKVKGDPGKGYYELYEYKAFLCKEGTTSSCYSYHCGDPGTAKHP